MAKRMSRATHEKVCDLVSRLIPEGGSVLEVSCGKGRNLVTLASRGFNVRGTNYSRHPLIREDLPVDTGVDVMRELPYEEGASDCVLLCDVIEHLSDHGAALDQVARVLRPGGVMIVPTPNVMRINSRLHFLFTGFVKVKRSFIGFDVPANNAWAFHNYPPHLPTFIYLMHSRGMRCELDAIEYKPKSILMWLCLSPLIWIMTAWKLHHSEKFLKGTDAAPALLSALTGFKALCGEAIVFIGHKQSVLEAPMPLKTTLPHWHEKIETEA